MYVVLREWYLNAVLVQDVIDTFQDVIIRSKNINLLCQTAFL